MSHHFVVPLHAHLVSLRVPRNLITRVSLLLSKYAKALYLFTRSDLKTILLPTVCLPLYPKPHMLTFL